MTDVRQRLERLERVRGGRDGCPVCAELAWQPIFLRADGTLYPGSPPDTCPECGRRPPGRKVLIGVDPEGL